MYVCACVYTYLRIRMLVYTRVDVRTHWCAQYGVHAPIGVCIYLCISVRTYLLIWCINVRMYVHIGPRDYWYMHLFVYALMCVCTYSCMHVL